MRILESIISKFRREERGTIAIAFAGAIVPIVVLIGVSYDFGRAFNTREIVQSTLDASVLAAGRAFDQSGSTQTAESAGRTFFTAALPKGTEAAVTAFSADGQGNVAMSASADVETTFMRIAGTNSLDIDVTAQSLSSDAGGMDVELAVVFDVTGSMSENNRITTAKTAANALLNTLMLDGPSTRSVRVSLVPFSQSVRLPTSRATEATNQPTSRVVNESYLNREYVCTRYWGNGSCREGSYQWVTRYRDVTYYRKDCMVERKASNNGGSNAVAYFDNPPSAGNYFNAFWSSSSNSTGCVPTYQVVPLTDSKATLTAAINALQPSGGTAGHIGTAWGWYTISERWSNFWPASSQPAVKDPVHRLKAVIIMTDGDFNYHYNSSFNDVNEPSSGSPNSGNGLSRTQASTICENMKTDGVEVFAVGVELPNGVSTARTTLENCVSDPNNLFDVHYYDVVNSLSSQTGLVAAFQSIGNDIASATGTGNSRLRVTR